MSTIESSPLPTADDMIELETHANWRADDIGDVGGVDTPPDRLPTTPNSTRHSPTPAR